jgi:hypothetical protein
VIQARAPPLALNPKRTVRVASLWRASPLALNPNRGRAAHQCDSSDIILFLHSPAPNIRLFHEEIDEVRGRGGGG